MPLPNHQLAPRRLVPSLAACLLLAGAVSAAPPDPAPPAPLTAEQDHARLMALLGIKTLRRGADGNPASPNAANSDESRVPRDLHLPDPLVNKKGEKVTTAKQWQSRRREIFEDFDREVYGRVPPNTPKVRWEVVSTTPETIGDRAVITKKLIGHVDNSAYPVVTVDINLTLTTPAAAPGPVPVIMEFGFVFPAGMRPRPQAPNAAPPRPDLAAANSGKRVGVCGSPPNECSG